MNTKVPSRHLAIFDKKKKCDEEMVESGTSGTQAIPIVDHDVVAAYVQQLTSCYSHLANFYYNRCNRIVIKIFLTYSSSDLVARWWPSN